MGGSGWLLVVCVCVRGEGLGQALFIDLCIAVMENCLSSSHSALPAFSYNTAGCQHMASPLYMNDNTKASFNPMSKQTLEC